MNKTMTAAVFMAGTLLLSPLSPAARTDDTVRERPFKKMIDELSLSRDQQAKLRELHRQMREEGRKVFEQMKKVRGKVREEFLKDKPSISVLDGYAEQLAGLHKRLIQTRHQHLLKAKAILTSEQFSKFVNHEWRNPGPERDSCPLQRKGRRGPHPDEADDR